MLGASPISPCLPPSVGSSASGTGWPPSSEPPSAGSYGSGSTSLTTAPRWRSSLPLATLLCPCVRSQARSQCAPLDGHVLVGTVIGSPGHHRVRVGVLVVVLCGPAVGVGLAGVAGALAGAG